MSTLKDIIKESLTNFANSIKETYTKKNDIIDNLDSTDSTKPLSANMGNNIKNQIDTLNSNTNLLLSKNYFMVISKQYLTSAGWYRIAKFVNTDQNGRNGAIDNSIDLILKRAYGNTNNEHHELKFLSVLNNRKFVSVANLSNIQKITKIRYTSSGCMEIYYDDNVSNIFSCTILNRYDAALSGRWETTFEASSTTDDQVLCTFDIPAND